MNDYFNTFLDTFTDNPQYVTIGIAAASEARRLAEKYNKDFFDCDDVAKITTVGKNNIGTLMRSDVFPISQIGSRKVVSPLSLVLWSISHFISF